MIKHFDHVAIVVRDVEAAKRFFGLLGFREDKSVAISGPQFSAYMASPFLPRPAQEEKNMWPRLS